MLGYIVTDCTYIGTSLIRVFVYLSILLSFSVSGYIIGILHACEQMRTCRSVCNSALENLCIILNSACIRTSIDSYFNLSLWLCMSVPVSEYVMTDCMCIYVCWSCLFFSFSLNIRISLRLYCDPLYVYMYVSWSVFLCVFFLNASIGFRLYCHWLSVYSFVSWSAYLSMFLFLCLSIRVYYR